MKLKPLASNMTQLTLNTDIVVLFSYETPVAALTEEGYVRTSHKWSPTTTRHINKWLDGVEAKEKPQEFFDSLTMKSKIREKIINIPIVSCNKTTSFSTALLAMNSK